MSAVPLPIPSLQIAWESSDAGESQRISRTGPPWRATANYGIGEGLRAPAQARGLRARTPAQPSTAAQRSRPPARDGNGVGDSGLTPLRQSGMVPPVSAEARRLHVSTPESSLASHQG